MISPSVCVNLVYFRGLDHTQQVADTTGHQLLVGKVFDRVTPTESGRMCFWSAVFAVQNHAAFPANPLSWGRLPQLKQMAQNYPLLPVVIYPT